MEEQHLGRSSERPRGSSVGPKKGITYYQLTNRLGTMGGSQVDVQWIWKLGEMLTQLGFEEDKGRQGTAMRTGISDSRMARDLDQRLMAKWLT